MHFDALTLACVVHEIQRRALPGRVQQVIMPDSHTLSLEVYGQGQRQYLWITAHSQDCRMHLSPARPRRGNDPATSFLELLRKYLRGGGLVSLEQPNPAERMVMAHLEHRRHGPSRLAIELTGRHCNLLLLDPEDRILGMLRRESAHTAHQRRPGATYSVPPLPDRLTPLSCTPLALEERLGQIDAMPGWRALTRLFLGMGPTQAREAAFRASGRVDVLAAQLEAGAVVETLRELWRPVTAGDWQPSAVQEEGGVQVYAPFPMRHRSDAQPVPALGELLAQLAPADPYRDARQTLQGEIRKAQTQLERRLAAAHRDLPPEGAADHLRLQAQWLLAYQHEIQPRQTSLNLPDGLGELALEPAQTPVQQAERMFRRARRHQRAAEIVPQRIRTLKRDRDYLAQLALDLNQARNRPEIAAVQEALTESRLLRTSARRRTQTKMPRAAGGPRQYVSAEGFRVLVGRNARQNEQVTFDRASARDLWLHVRDRPGSHVLIKSGGQTVSMETLEAAAQLAAYHSDRRGESGVSVTVVEKRHVYRPKGGRPGQVLLRRGHGTTIQVNAALPDWPERDS